MGLESAGWTTPPMSLDLTDVNLPRRCECGAWLPLSNKWEVEEDDEGLVVFVKCGKCGVLVSRVLTTRGNSRF